MDAESNKKCIWKIWHAHLGLRTGFCSAEGGQTQHLEMVWSPERNRKEGDYKENVHKFRGCGCKRNPTVKWQDSVVIPESGSAGEQKNWNVQG